MGEKKISELTPEEQEERRRIKRERKRAYLATPEGKAAKSKENAEYRLRNLEASRARTSRAHKKRRAEQGDVVRAYERNYRATKPDIVDKASRRKAIKKASPKYIHALMLDIKRRVPNYDCKDDIVALTALLVCEGIRLGDAVKKATKSVLKDESFQAFKTVPVEDCFWLEAEPEPAGDDPF